MLVLGLTSTSWSHTGKITCLDYVIKAGSLLENVEVPKGNAGPE